MLLEDNASAFIVRVWLEHREVEGAPATWRGSVEHVESGRIRYFTELDELVQFVRSFLDEMGATIDRPKDV